MFGIIILVMALVKSEAVETFEEVVKKDDKDNINETMKGKVIKRIYHC
jgi:hypothetical protein